MWVLHPITICTFYKQGSFFSNLGHFLEINQFHTTHTKYIKNILYTENNHSMVRQHQYLVGYP